VRKGVLLVCYNTLDFHSLSGWPWEIGSGWKLGGLWATCLAPHSVRPLAASVSIDSTASESAMEMRMPRSLDSPWATPWDKGLAWPWDTGRATSVGEGGG
jgi:hypothetical protein